MIAEVTRKVPGPHIIIGPATSGLCPKGNTRTSFHAISHNRQYITSIRLSTDIFATLYAMPALSPSRALASFRQPTARLPAGGDNAPA